MEADLVLFPNPRIKTAQTNNKKITNFSHNKKDNSTVQLNRKPVTKIGIKDRRSRLFIVFISDRLLNQDTCSSSIWRIGATHEQST